MRARAERGAPAGDEVGGAGAKQVKRIGVDALTYGLLALQRLPAPALTSAGTLAVASRVYP